MGLAAVMDKATSEVAASPEEKLAAWTQHYTELLAPAEAAAQEWVIDSSIPVRDRIPSLGREMVWGDVCAYLMRVPATKAPGPSGVSVAFLRACVDVAGDDGAYPAEPTSDMGKVLFALVKAMWTQGVVPAVMQRAAVVSIFKDGDSTDPANYRGISLCETVLKIVTGILAGRLMQAVETLPCRLIDEQAGFRARQECAGQVATLLEICQRRRNADLGTFIAFLDFKKAFDMVPHSLLLQKLERFGVRGRALRFIRSLYDAPVFTVRGDGGVCGVDVRLTRGVRQGCPLSPILFDIFIDDLIECVRAFGPVVPGLDGRRVPGLLFADDTVLLAESAVELQASLDLVGRWAAANGMEFGIAKCGVMAIGDEMPEEDFVLGGHIVPRVHEYKYLGVFFNDELALEKMARGRVGKAVGLLATLTPFLTGNLPITLKWDVLRSNVIPMLAYGGEIFGMSKVRVAPLDRILSKAMAGLTRGWGRAARDSLLAELDLPTVHGVTSTMRRRALGKYPELRTVIGDLCNRRVKSRRCTWLSGGSRWLALTRTKCARRGFDFETEVVKPQELDVVVSPHRSKGMQRRMALDFGETAEFLEMLQRMPRFAAKYAKGISGLVALRAGGLMFAPQAAKAGLISEEYLHKCPCCGRECKEDDVHFLLKCPAFSAERAEHLGAIRQAIARMRRGARLSSTTEAVLVQGGARGGLSLGRRWYKAKKGGATGSPYCLGVISFLQAVHGKRCALLWASARRVLPTSSQSGTARTVALPSATPAGVG
jgi:hypothetical protein